MPKQILPHWFLFVVISMISIALISCGKDKATPEPSSVSAANELPTTLPTTTIEEFEQPKFGQVKVISAIVRELPDISSNEVERLPMGTIRLVAAQQGEWVKLVRNSDLSTIGWTLADFLILTTEIPTREATATASPSATIIPTDAVVTTNSTPTPCATTIPQGWKPYYVHEGDTLSNLSERGGVSIEQIKLVNCRTSDIIVLGEPLMLPNHVYPIFVADTPIAPPIPTDTPDLIATATQALMQPASPTDTPTGTPAPSNLIEPAAPTETDTPAIVLTITVEPIAPVPPTDTLEAVPTIDVREDPIQPLEPTATEAKP